MIDYNKFDLTRLIRNTTHDFLKETFLATGVDKVKNVDSDGRKHKLKFWLAWDGLEEGTAASTRPFSNFDFLQPEHNDKRTDLVAGIFRRLEFVHGMSIFDNRESTIANEKP